ncbi:hypothetical protein BKA56DRAFT_594260 [Ilyonectria sp. MPI-CAGE-AT-0026]|nr:hypothetical protein BKA56DRAFT_594260 [Ilyonectria sp. MPI-CAGE-AT-0026]
MSFRGRRQGGSPDPARSNPTTLEPALSSEGDDPEHHLHVLGVRTIVIPNAKLPWVDFDSALGDRR